MTTTGRAGSGDESDGGSLAACLEGLASIGLPELEATAAFLTRRDRKYVVPLADAAELVARLDGGTRVLEIGGRRTFRYESVYFDTPDGASYLGAARRRPRRFKVRTRTYLDSGTCLLELKTRDARGRTVKERRAHPFEQRDALDATARAFAASCPLVVHGGATLAAVLTTSYARATLLAADGSSRLTIDTEVQARTPVGALVVLVGAAIVETKSSGAPSEADRILWSLGHRPTVVSKFGTGLAALRPDLPANKWTRALRNPWLVAGAAARRPPALAVPANPVPAAPAQPAASPIRPRATMGTGRRARAAVVPAGTGAPAPAAGGEAWTGSASW